MKRLFLCSSFAEVANKFINFAKEDLNGKTITFIPTASIHETTTFYVDEGRQALKKIGLWVDELEISEASTEVIQKKLQHNDYIYVTGGNTFFLLQELQKKGADSIIKDQINSGKLYIGESAGSVILSPSIEYVKDMDDCSLAPDLNDYSALHILEVYPLPHYSNYSFKENIDKIISKYSTHLHLCPFSNSQALCITENSIVIE